MRACYSDQPSSKVPFIPELTIAIIFVDHSHKVQSKYALVPYVRYYLSKKSWHIAYSELLYKVGQDFLDIQYYFDQARIQDLGEGGGRDF